MVDREDWIKKLYREQEAGYQATFTGKRKQSSSNITNSGSKSLQRPM